MLTRHLYPQFSAHKKLHEQFKSELHELLQAPLAGKISLSMAALAMIRDWLVEHIGNSDRAFADYIHKTISTPPAARSAFLNFDDAVRAHFVAMDKLVAYLSNPSGSSPASDVYKDDQCPLGRWIYGAGRAHADNREYTELRTVHAEFHRSAGQLLEVANQGRSVANRMTLGSDSAFARSSSAIVKAIMALRAKL
jgi:methyl-accepting chemotaxis protein